MQKSQLVVAAFTMENSAPHQTIPNRIVIYAKDVMNITGRKERAARNLLARIRRKYKKKKTEFVSIDEFCDVPGIKKESVREFLRLIKER